MLFRLDDTTPEKRSLDYKETNESNASSSQTFPRNTIMTEPTSSSSIKAEFIDVLTVPDLHPAPSQTSSEEFPTILTESSLLSSSSLIKPDDVKLIELYDYVFSTPDMYKNFTEGKLAPWKNTLDFKYFDTLYLQHRSTKETITQLRSHAQALLERADRLHDYDLGLRREINRHLPSITRKELRDRLYRPVAVYPRPPGPIYRQTFPSSSRSIRPPSPPTPRMTNPRIYRCFQCGDAGHIKWYCNQYRCRYCRRIAPGHSQKDCPSNKEKPYDDGYRGYFDIGGEEDGNLTGEC